MDWTHFISSAAPTETGNTENRDLDNNSSITKLEDQEHKATTGVGDIPQALPLSMSTNEVQCGSSGISGKKEEMLREKSVVEPVAVNSFVPIIEKLKGLILEDNTYHLDAPLSSSSTQGFVEFAGRVNSFILTDNCDGDYPKVSPNTITRLAKFQNPDSPFLCSLRHLSLANADRCLDYLDLLVTPSLERLEVAEIPSHHHVTISYFLKELLHQTPGVSSISLGPGLLSHGVLQTSLQFHNLRQLTIIGATNSLTFKFFQEVSALLGLNSFTFEASSTFEYVAHSTAGPPPTVGTEMVNSSATSSVEIRHRATQSIMVPARRPSAPFPSLKKISIVSQIHLIRDLIYHLFPGEVKEVNLTLFRVVPDTSSRIYIARPSVWAQRDSREMAMDQYLQHGEEFVSIVETILSRGCIENLVIGYKYSALKSPNQPVKLSAFPLSTFCQALSHPSLSSIEVRDCKLDDVEMAFRNAASLKIPLPLKCICLPVTSSMDESEQIGLSTLCLIAQNFPDLMELQCQISLSKEHFGFDLQRENIKGHGLHVLSVGGSSEFGPKKESEIAKYLWSLFPSLEKLVTHKGCSEVSWENVDQLIKMAQWAVRTVG